MVDLVDQYNYCFNLIPWINLIIVLRHFIQYIINFFRTRISLLHYFFSHSHLYIYSVYINLSVYINTKGFLEVSFSLAGNSCWEPQQTANPNIFYLTFPIFKVSLVVRVQFAIQLISFCYLLLRMTNGFVIQEV